MTLFSHRILLALVTGHPFNKYYVDTCYYSYTWCYKYSTKININDMVCLRGAQSFGEGTVRLDIVEVLQSARGPQWKK